MNNLLKNSMNALTFGALQKVLSLMFEGHNDPDSSPERHVMCCAVRCCRVWLLCQTWKVFVRDLRSHLRHKVLREGARAVVTLELMLL